MALTPTTWPPSTALTRHNSRVRPAPGALLRHAVFAGPRRGGHGPSRWGVSAAAGPLGLCRSGLARWAHSSRSAFWPCWGMLNLAAVLRADPGPGGATGRRQRARLLGSLRQVSQPVGGGGWSARSSRCRSTPCRKPPSFALTATQFGGWQHALVPWRCCSCWGCLLTDGINGLWIARLIRRADQTARIASRVMGLVVAGVQPAGGGLWRGQSCCCRAWDAWSEGRELQFGAALVAVIAPQLPGCDAAGAAPCGRCLKTLSAAPEYSFFCSLH
jgi:hypothetical protein